ncbi:MAG: DUF4037 domain-containing protein [Clostridia bacterium]|nr:DUF4037 domain-containing protein [Clostridia bacterium]
MVEKLFEELKNLPEVEAIALGGSRAGENFDEKSDYDVYLYCTGAVSDDVRKNILDKYCSYIELSNHFWELEDNCTLKNGIDIDILYRNIEDFGNDVASVVESFNARTGYTTCMWHNLMTCKIIYDEKGRLKALKERFDVPYPQELKKNIIKKNMSLLSGMLPSYDGQILKALRRRDIVSVNHRTSAFMESYFDVLFALNEATHPGEKRLVNLSKKLSILPEKFEENINKLFTDLFANPDVVENDIANIVSELKKII